MKRFYFILLLFVIVIDNINAQTHIPDAAFAATIRAQCAICIDVNDDLTANALTLIYLNVSSQTPAITDMTGIDGFANLEQLNCTHNQLINLPALPASLTFLDCTHNQLTNLPALPNSLTVLDFSHNQLTNLPALPNNLISLHCSNNQLTNLPFLSDNITGDLDFSYNQITNVVNFPNSLDRIYCQYNQLTSLPPFPNTLRELVCGSNQLTSLPTLPNHPNFYLLNCPYNQLTTLPTLPSNLYELYCQNNQLTTLPVLPNYLDRINCNYNQLTNLPTLPNSLNSLQCQDNLLLSLPALPNNLTNLNCQSNQLTSLPALPNILRLVMCSFNQLTSLPSLPNNLQILHCNANQLVNLPALPASLQYLLCGINPNLICLPTLPNNLISLFANYQTAITCLPNIPTGIAAANTLPVCSSPCIYNIIPPTFHYTVACDNTITWTIDNAQGYTTSHTITNNGIDITNLTSPPTEGDLITLTCTNSTGQTISASQPFTTQDALDPTFTYNFSNNGTILNVITATNALAQDLSVSATPSTTSTATHTAAQNQIHTDVFAVANAQSNVDITVSVQAVYSGFGGNALNTVCKTTQQIIPAQNCATITAYITGSNVQQGQPSLLTSSAGFTPMALAAYTYLWNDGSTNADLAVNPITVATYTVTITSDRGCTATATAHLPTWGINAIDSVCAYSSTPICVPLVCNKPMVNAQGLVFTFNIVGNASIGTGIDFNTTIVPNAAIISNYNLATNETTIIVYLTGAGSINTINPLPSQIGCLNLTLNANAAPGDTIIINGTVEEDYGFGNIALFSLQSDSIFITGNNALQGTLYNRNSNIPLHSNAFVRGIDAACASLGANMTLDANGVFSLPITTNMTHLNITKTTNDAVNTPFTNASVIGATDITRIITFRLGTIAIPDIYAALAADVDNSGTIDAADATFTARRTVGIYSNFFGKDWKTFSRAWANSITTFDRLHVPIVPNCLALPNNIAQSCTATTEIFEGVLIGDADNSWTAGNEAQYRAIPPKVMLDVANMTMPQTGLYRIGLYSDTPVYGLDLRQTNIPTNIDSLYITNNNNPNDSNFGIIQNFISAQHRYAATAYMNDTLTTVAGDLCSNTVVYLYVKSNIPPTNTFLQSLSVTINGAAAQTVSCTVATENNPRSATFSLFPNPAHTHITLRTTNTDLIDQTIQVHDVLGRLLHTTTLQSTEQTIDLSEYTAGMYMLRIGRETLKVVKQ